MNDIAEGTFTPTPPPETPSAEIRTTALQHVVDLDKAAGKVRSAAEVIADAAAFEAYLKGSAS